MPLLIEPDPEPRDGPWHRKIVDQVRITNTVTGHTCKLECGHVVQTFGRLGLAGGRVLCTQCRDEAEAPPEEKL